MSSTRMLKAPALPIFFAIGIALPLLLPIPGFESVPPLAMGVAMLSIPLLMLQLSFDVVYQRQGGQLRLVALILVVAAFASWMTGVRTFGFRTSAALSCLNWIALVAVMVAGQALLRTRLRVEWMLNTWVVSHAAIAGVVVVYMLATFGGQILSSTDRGPFQAAMRLAIPSWPNYFGVALALALCIAYGRIATGSRSIFTRLQFLVLALGLMLTFSRGAYVACIAALLAMTLIAGKRRRIIYLFMGIVLFVAAVGLGVPTVRYQFIATFDVGTSQNIGVLERLAFAREALIMWWERPFFGIGFVGFSELAEPSLVYSTGPQAALGSVHNEYLTGLLKGGLIGLGATVLFLANAVSILRRCLRSAVPGLRQQAVIGSGITVTLLLAGLTLESLRTIALSGIFWVLIGALDGTLRNPDLLSQKTLAVRNRSETIGIEPGVPT